MVLQASHRGNDMRALQLYYRRRRRRVLDPNQGLLTEEEDREALVYSCMQRAALSGQGDIVIHRRSTLVHGAFLVLAHVARSSIADA
jgi:hypothetical protein